MNVYLETGEDGEKKKKGSCCAPADGGGCGKSGQEKAAGESSGSCSLLGGALGKIDLNEFVGKCSCQDAVDQRQAADWMRLGSYKIFAVKK